VASSALRCWGLALWLAACSASERQFPLRDALWQDSDQRPVHIDCEKRPTDKDRKHVSCAPEPYVSPLGWDAADNTLFRPLASLLAIDIPGSAWNVNAFDEVPDSAWFQNRMGRRRPRREELLAGACTPEDHLDGERVAAGSWVIDQGKPNGASPGFRIKVADKYKFLLKTDSKQQPERPTAASAIGAAIYHAVGFNTSCEQIVYFDPAVLSLKPGLVAKDNTGATKAFNHRQLDWVLRQAVRKGALVRMQASAWLPGYLLGPFRYEGTRGDDPNDLIPHQERRELRGGRVLAAWLNHFDAREQNTMDSWIAQDPAVSDSSPGYVRHYYLDTGDLFGSEWDWDAISRRLGHSYLLDLGYVGADLLTLGALERPWERVQKTPGFELFGYFHHREFDPAKWKNEYPNPAFSRATEHDNAWMTRILSRFEREDIEALVTLGKFTRAEHAAFLTDILEQRLQKIVARYFRDLSPLSDPRLDGHGGLCLIDLARRRAPTREGAFRYRALLHRGDRVHSVEVRSGPAAELCLSLPHERASRGEASSYIVVAIDNGQSRYPVAVHLYDLGPQHGFRLVGLTRPEAPWAEASQAILRDIWQ
jgi:hypothetical protein